MGSINGGIKHSSEEEVTVVMVPFPLQGHLNQLLHLSRLISSHNIPVHYVGTTAHNRQARRRIHGWDPLSNPNNIIFQEFPSLSFQSPPPDPTSPALSHLQPLFDALSALRRPVRQLIRRLSAASRRVVVIYDSLMGSVVQDFVEFPNAEAYTFHSVSAYTIFFFLWENKGRPFAVEGEILESLPSTEGCFTPEFLKFVRGQHECMKLNSGRIYNTCRVVERQFMELLEKPEISGNKKQWALGPFNPVHLEYSGEFNKPRHRCLKWLDGQAKNSVIFVSFGTTTTLPEKQIMELAAGLERSKRKFIWVLRDADGGGDRDYFDGGEVRRVELLLKGFEERVRERGIVVREWAPQLEILGHSSTGGFMSHCGWNSCMESISMGVPIAAWPMHSDQPRNAVLITKVLKIGVVVKDWGRKDAIVTSAAVSEAVGRLMGSDEGGEMRRRAAELGGAVRKAAGEGGLSRMELDSFISHITS